MPSTNFRKLGERSIHKSSLLDITEGTFEGPDGERFQRDLVHHPGAVVVVPYDDATDEVVLVRQYRAPLDNELLEIPAGKRDVKDEPNQVTAARELAEETALAADRWELIGHFYNSPGFSDEESWCYLARDLREVPGSRHSIEEQHMTVERHRLGDVLHLILTGEITDAKSIIGLLLAEAVVRGR
ncbi:MAG TPA: NUDIX hydrolase [Acidimicrobiales bacterium]|nr:NUDIX hydrolase [Acidimicrobiales bacterium]